MNPVLHPRLRYLREQAKLLAGHPLRIRNLPHLVVAPLHQTPLQLDRVPYVHILLDACPSFTRLHQPLQQRMEPGVVALAEEQEEVEACNLTPLVVRGELVGG